MIKLKSGLSKIVLTAALAVLLFTAFTAVASATTIYVPEGGNQTIQQAVNNATPYDTIIVRDGTYNENVDVSVAHLSIRSQNGSANCIVNASNSGDHVFAVQQDYVNILGFTVENATKNWKAGICLIGRQHCNISNNTANSNTQNGIYIDNADDNNVSCNWVQNNSVNGFQLQSGSTGNTIENNNIIANGMLQADGSYRYQFYNNQNNQRC